MQKFKITQAVDLYLTHLRQYIRQFTILFLANGLLFFPETHAAPGELDLTFEKRWNSTGTIDQILVLSNDQFLLSSSAFSLKSNKDASGRLIQQPLLRCNPDGSLDPSFVLIKNGVDRVRLSVGAAPGALAVDAREGILFAGSVVGSSGGDISIHHLVRFFPDGSLDDSFNTGSGPDDHVRVIAPLPDGRIWIAGLFAHVNEVSAPYVALLNQYGEIDEKFMVGEGFNKPVVGGFADDQGRFVVVGNFDHYNGQPVNGLVRINPDGSLDSSFDIKESYVKKHATIISGPDDSVFVSEPRGNLGGAGLPPIVKYNSNGNQDPLFKFGDQFDQRLVKHMSLSIDGSHLFIVVGESNSNDRVLSVLKIDSVTGEIDDSFSDKVQPLIGSSLSLHVQSDLGLLLAGDFNRVNGVESNGFARLQTEVKENSAPVIKHFTGSQILTHGDGLNLMTSVVAHPHPTYQWYFDGVPLPSENKPNLQRHFANSSHTGTYHVVISNEEGEMTTNPVEVVVRRGQPGSIDHDFVFPSVFERIEPLWVRAFLLLDNQRVLIAGHLQIQQGDNSGGPDGGKLPHIVRLLSDGSFDPTFDPGTGPDAGVDFVLVLPSGDLLLGGAFSKYNGIDRRGFAITTRNGQLLGIDNGTVPGNIQRTLLELGVEKIVSGAIAPDGALYLAGHFNQDGQRKTLIIRLNSNGIMDSDFTPFEAEEEGGINVYLHPDQTLWAFFNESRNIWHFDAGGNILQEPAQFDGHGQRTGFTQFLANSAGDTLISGISPIQNKTIFLQRWKTGGGFDPDFPIYHPELLNGLTTTMALAHDDYVYVGGLVQDSASTTLIRLTSTGALDSQFQYNEFGTSVYNLLVLPDGDLIVLGDFVDQSGVQSSLARIVGVAQNNTIHLQGRVVDNQFLIKFNSKIGTRYQLLSKSSLSDATWVRLGETTSEAFETTFSIELDDRPFYYFHVTQIEE